MTIQIPDNDKTMTIYCSGCEKHEAGVGLAVNSTISSSENFQPISSCLAILKIEGIVRLHTFSVYASAEPSYDDAKHELYMQLQDALDSIPGKTWPFFRKDFNAHVDAGREGGLRKFGLGKINDNGLRLLSFEAFSGLAVQIACSNIHANNSLYGASHLERIRPFWITF